MDKRIGGNRGHTMLVALVSYFVPQTNCTERGRVVKCANPTALWTKSGHDHLIQRVVSAKIKARAILVLSFRLEMYQVSTIMKEGKMFAETASGLVEVVSVNAAELARLPYTLSEGVYVVGTGSTGAAAGLGICGEPLR